MIDYDMESEDELQEENAEDLKSNENSIDEEDDVEEEEEKWIVPDGHFSDDEVSQADPDDNVNKINGIMEIMEIRRNYPKYIHIIIAERGGDAKVHLLSEQLKAKPFGNQSFPIIQSDKKFEEKKKTGINLFIEDRLDDVVQEIHGSYLPKDTIIKSINEKYNKISKAALSEFFKENALKTTIQGKV
jgi:hypothetical protein